MFPCAVRPRGNWGYVRAGRAMVGGVGPHRQACRCTKSRSYLQPDSISGAELVVKSALFSLGIDGRIREVRSGDRVYLAPDYPASALVTGIDAVADSLRGGCRRERSTPPQIQLRSSGYKPRIESPAISRGGSGRGAATVGP